MNDYFFNLPQVKRKVFISYHHADQNIVDNFKFYFSDTLDLFTDCSLDMAIDSTNLDYVNQKIREDYIVGTSISIVICGMNTWKRKCVDWEIYSTLHNKHALLGVCLDSSFDQTQNLFIVPSRLHANIQSGYAHYIPWTNEPSVLQTAIEVAINRGKNNNFIDNSAQKMARNL